MIEIKHVSPSDLVQYARNPRKNDPHVERMAAAIKEFGFKIPILAKPDGTIIDGHLRHKAAQRLKLRAVPVVYADDLTEAQVKAFRLLANKSVEWSDWDDDLLKAELDELLGEGLSHQSAGFEPDFVEQLGQKLSITELSDFSQSDTKRNLGNQRHKIKPVLYVDQIDLFERAIRLTGETNRGEAVMTICKEYIESKTGQFDAGF